MNPTHPTADWQQLNDRFYRRREVYDMLWGKLDLSKFVIAAAPFGGPIAMVRDERKILVLEENTQPVMQIFTASGRLLSRFMWTHHGLVKMGWTDAELLVCVTENATVIILNIWGAIVKQFTLGAHCQRVGIHDAVIWGSGFVVCANDFQFFEVRDLEEPRPRLFADAGLTDPPSCLACIEVKQSQSRQTEVLVGSSSGTIFTLDASNCVDQLIKNGPIVKMALSPNGKILACFTVSGLLWVVSSDFTKNLSEFDTRSKVPPQQIVWCGADSVIMYWDKILLMVGPHGHWIKYTYEQPLVLVPEVDGVRIVSAEKTEFLQRVPNVTEDIFKIGSTSPSAMLYDAMDLFVKKNPRADENIRLIKSDLQEAVDKCIEAALHEADYAFQKPLMQAASFGKSYLEFYNAERYVEAAKTIRILNAVRHYEVGIPLTIQQFERLTVEVLIDRLVNRRHHLLALKICQSLNMKVDKVMVHWACDKVQSSMDDGEIRAVIVEKLKDIPGISFATIAYTAFKKGKPDLATMLLDYEAKAGEQVPLLLSMQQDELALIKAIESGDTDLVYHVVLHLKRSKSLAEFFKLIRHKKLAEDLFVSFCKQQDLDLLKTYYYQSDLPIESAHVTALEAFKQQDMQSRSLGFRKASALYTEGKDVGFMSKAIEEQERLYREQEEMEARLRTKVIGDSLSDTIYKCFTLGDVKRAQKLKSDFKVSDRCYWWLRVRALGELRDWDQLDKFSKEKKSPIGYEPFADVCIKAKALPEAAPYVQKISDPLRRAQYYVEIGLYKEAADAAYQAKNADVLNLIRSKTHLRDVHAQIDNYLRSLK
eukprot:TRINITY_DN1382_c0_g2_i1.p1 TRINITY_DN1382_c0_g2~~TRINITY_DN1382_c0_g2_i1.p1  ORF type:complete len:828 (-),score=186.60 TRINITY_DN1382_c0_g2_i1:1462-3921(-)